MHYFVNDDARRNRPNHLPLTLPEFSDFHDEHREMMDPPSPTPACATSPDAGWFNDQLSDKEVPKTDETLPAPKLDSSGEALDVRTGWELD